MHLASKGIVANTGSNANNNTDIAVHVNVDSNIDICTRVRVNPYAIIFSKFSSLLSIANMP